MKKILLALAMLASVTVASAQTKTVAAAKAAAEKAQKAADDPKKATKTATWLKLGQAYLKANDAPAGNGWVGASQQDLALIMGEVKPLSSDQVEVGGSMMYRDVYETCNYYFNENGMLSMIEVTAPAYEDALDRALAAYQMAASTDVKAKKTKDIVEAFKTINSKYTTLAYDAYTFGNLPEASVYFEKAVAALASEPLCEIDTNSVYNAGLTAWISGDLDRSKGFFEKCIEIGYVGGDGEAYAKLADIADKQGDKEAQKNYLEAGFQAYPQSQAILIGLINYYLASGEGTERLFELLDLAKVNEPENASLWYVEGNIHEKLGQEAEAIASWEKCSEINPTYEYGYIGEGIHFFNKALDIQEKCSDPKLSDADYFALQAEMETALKACIAPFEKAYAVSQENDLKVNIAEYLKQICYRYSSDSQEYMDKYNFYKEVVDTKVAK